MRRASVLALVTVASCHAAVTADTPRPIADAAAPPVVAIDAGAPSPAAVVAVAEPPLTWGTRPDATGPLYVVVDGMCVHGEVWPLENETLFTHGNPVSGAWSRGKETTFARFVDDGLDTNGAELTRTAPPTKAFGYAPMLIRGRWPGPAFAVTGFVAADRMGTPDTDVFTHDEQGWKLVASSSADKKGNTTPAYLDPVYFREHLIIPRRTTITTADSYTTRIEYRAVPPLAGIATLNHTGYSDDSVALAATDDAIYAIAQVSSGLVVREWRDGKARDLGAFPDNNLPFRIYTTKPLALGGTKKLTEIVDGKLFTIDPKLGETASITTVSAAPNGDLWIAESTHTKVLVARRGDDGRHTRIDVLPIPAPAVVRPEERELRHSARMGGALAGVEHDDAYVVGRGGSLFHREGDAWKEVPLPKPPWATNRYRVQTLAMQQKGDLYVNAGYGEKGAGWTTPERYRAILRVKRPREVLRCNEPPVDMGGFETGKGFMSFPPLADDTCTTPFVVILRTALGLDAKPPDAPQVRYDAKYDFPLVRDSVKATPALGATVDLVEIRSGNQRYLGAAVPKAAIGRDFVTALAKRVRSSPELRPEIVCGTPPAPVRTIKVDVATGKIAP